MYRLFISFLFLVSFVYGSHIYAQPYSANLTVVVFCDGIGGVVIDGNYSLLEGEIYEVEPYTLPASYSGAQFLYDALVGSIFYLDTGALTENIDIFLTLVVNCNSGTYNDGQFFFESNITIFNSGGEVTGTYPLGGNGAVLRIVKTPGFNNFLTQIGLEPDSALTYAFMITPGLFTLEGITTINTEDYIEARIQHFSTIVGATLTAVTDVTDNFSKPQIFRIEQNYPNPFNPNTIISYRLPVQSYVTLKIYDIIGNDVATLVNEEKGPGTYEVEFSATGGSASGGNAYNLSSGIYFYQLRAGNFIQTKKMVLLK